MKTSPLDNFLQFEKKYNLFDVEIQSVPIWHLIRIHIYRNYYQKKPQNNLVNKPFKKNKMNFFTVIKQLPYFMFKNPLLSKKHKDILIFNHQRRVKNNGKYYCLYTDLLIPTLNHSNVILEKKYLNHHYKPIPNNNIFYLDYITFMTAIKWRILSLFSLNEKDMLVINKIRYIINNEFNLNIKYKEFTKIVQKHLNAFKIDLKYYEKILKRTQPKLIIEVVHYEETRFVINHLAKKYNIPTIELQHGVMGEHHIAYNFLGKPDLSCFPEYIFTFGNYWIDHTRFPINKNKLFSVGWPYLESKSSMIINENPKQQKVILIVSQDGQIAEELFKISKELLRKVDSNNYRILYKLHPKEYQFFDEIYSNYVDENLTFISNNSKDIYYYLSIADYVIGVASTVIFEALNYGLKPLILETNGHEYMHHLIDNNHATLIKSAKDVIEALSKETELQIDNLNYYWEDNSLSKMNKYIDLIINRNN